MRPVYVAGTGSTRFGKHMNTPIEALAVDAGAQALLQSGIDRQRVGFALRAPRNDCGGKPG